MRRVKCVCGRGPVVSPALGKCEWCMYEEQMRQQAGPLAPVIPLSGRKPADTREGSS